MSLAGSKHDSTANYEEYQNTNLDNGDNTVDYYVVQTLRTFEDKDVSTLKQEEEEAKLQVKEANDADEVKKSKLDKDSDKKERDVISKAITKRKAEWEQREKISAVKIHWPFSQ